MGQYVLPDLDYDYGDLEPAIIGEINELHHGKHHAAYVKGANDTLEQIEEARDRENFGGIVGLETTLAFHLAGHALHQVWWKNLSPNGGDKPVGELAAAIDDQFGSFDAFQAHFTATALGVQGSGWAVLAWDSLGQRLAVFQFFDQQANLPAGIVPLLMLDVWEHAYYLDYKNVRADYVKAFWTIADWANVQQRFDVAREKTAGLLLLS